MSAPPAHRPPRPGAQFAIRFLLAGLVVLLTAGVAVATTIKREADTIVDAFQPATRATEDAKQALDGVERGKPQTLLLVGDDARKGEPSGQRSDTMILVRLDGNAKVTSMLSLPRDLIVAGGPNVRLNAAFAGGPAKLIDRLKILLSTPDEPFEIHHYVSIRFSAFAAAVNAFGCFYTDIDRRYFNDNNPPVADTKNYATIDVKAGYQRLCGEDSLDYVRFRHLDNDVVREARQQHYLSDARGQIATSKLIFEGNTLAKTILKFVDTDIRTARGILGVIGLGLDVVGRPTKRIQLDTTDTKEGALQTTPADLAAAARRFLHPGSPKRATASDSDPQPSSSGTGTGTRRRPKAPKTPRTLGTGTAEAKQAVQASGIARDFTAAPIYVPKLVQDGARYREEDSRGYDIASDGGRAFPWQGYRLVVQVDGARGGIGQFYGIQGTSWKRPPVLDMTTDSVRLAGRTYRIEYDGARIRRLIWRTPNGTYWVTNSLKNSLTNAEMRAIARSLVPYRP